MKLKPVTPKHSIDLSDDNASVEEPLKSGKALESAMEKHVKRISEAQRVFYADGRFALLIVLQGRDASGKDGTIRKVFTRGESAGLRGLELQSADRSRAETTTSCGGCTRWFRRAG